MKIRYIIILALIIAAIIAAIMTAVISGTKPIATEQSEQKVTTTMPPLADRIEMGVDDEIKPNFMVTFPSSDELQFVDKDIVAAFEGTEYRIGIPSLVQLNRNIREANQHLEALIETIKCMTGISW